MFDATNKVMATFNRQGGGRIAPVAIKNSLYILQTGLEAEVLAHDATTVYTNRDVLDSEFITVAKP